MTVAAIMKTKGHDTITADKSAPVSEIAEILAKNKIGAVVLCDGDRHIEGIVSERDVVRLVGLQGAAALSQPVSSIMTKDVMTCTVMDAANEVMGRMNRGRFRHMPVVEDGKLIGVISIGDVVKHKIAQVEHEAEQMRSYITTT